MLKKILFPALLTSGIFFCCCCFLISMLRTKSVDIRIEDKQIFDEDMRTLFSLQMAAFLSVGMGVTSAALIGWSYSVRKSSEVEKQLSSLQKRISLTDSLIEELQHSPFEQVDSQLITLVTNELPTRQVTAVSLGKDTAPSNNPQPMVMSMPSKVAEPLIVFDGVLATETEIFLQTRQKAISLFACAQSVLGFTQVGGSQDIEQKSATTNLDDSLDNTRAVQELQGQLQQICEQMNLLDKAVQNKTQQASLNMPLPHRNGDLPPRWGAGNSLHLQEMLVELVAEHNGKLIALDIQPEHLRMLINTPTNETLSHITQGVKGRASHH